MRQWRWLADDFTVSKRQLGWLMIVAGVMLAGGVLVLEALRAGQGGFGAIQQIAAAGGLLSAVIGLTLLPLGDRPA